MLGGWWGLGEGKGGSGGVGEEGIKKKKNIHKLFFSKFVRKVVLGMDHHKGN